MALDTADKRASSIGVGLGFLRVWPTPDGAALSQADRQHTGLSYRGILASAPSVVGTLVGVWSRIIECRSSNQRIECQSSNKRLET